MTDHRRYTATIRVLSDSHNGAWKRLFMRRLEDDVGKGDARRLLLLVGGRRPTPTLSTARSYRMTDTGEDTCTLFLLKGRTHGIHGRMYWRFWIHYRSEIRAVPNWPDMFDSG
jgi:hypothetical protein